MLLAARHGLGGGSRILELPDNYLAYAAVAPPSAPVKLAVARALQSYAELGGGAFPVWAEQREQLRAELGKLIASDAANIAFVPGTTRGISDLALSIRWRAGDSIVLFTGEFPANVTPWQRAAELFGLDIRFISLEHAITDEDSFLVPLEKALAAGVRLVAVSAVQFQTGLRMPLSRIAQLCQRHGAQLAVDAIQAAGIVPLDVGQLGVDYLVGGAHKWLMGTEGAGFLYAAPNAMRSLEPRTAGWLSHEDALCFLVEGPGKLRYDRPIQKRVRFLEGGSQNTLGYAALGASLKSIQALGPDNILRHVSGYLDALEAGLRARGFVSLRAVEPERRSGILALAPPRGLEAVSLVRGLSRRGVFASMPEGLLRFAPHYPNAYSEIDSVLAAVDDTLLEERP